MNICATLFFVVPAAAIYAHKHTFAGAIIGLLVRLRDRHHRRRRHEPDNRRVVLVRQRRRHHAAHPARSAPVQLDQTVLNSALTLLVYKAVSNLITPKKDQVKGR